MVMPEGIRLDGLEGTNPLGYLAALGIQVAFACEEKQPSLWWTDDVTPRAVVDTDFGIDRITERALRIFREWLHSRAMNPTRHDGTSMPKADSLKLSPDDLREYVGQHQTHAKSGPQFPSAIVAEGSVDRSGAAKPSDLYFAAGQVVFLRQARKILGQVAKEEVVAALRGPWAYHSELPSMGWDIVDDRVYALRPDDPSKDKKQSNPGAEALAILGLSLYPVFAGRHAGRARTLTQGCSGDWKRGSFSWPLWTRPMSLTSVRSVLAQIGTDAAGEQKWASWFRSCSVRQVLTSTIRRSSQGGYGSFGPPRVTWTSPSNLVV